MISTAEWKFGGQSAIEQFDDVHTAMAEASKRGTEYAQKYGTCDFTVKEGDQLRLMSTHSFYG
jgi:hypothetical protein